MTEIKVILSGVGGVGRNVTRLLSARQDFRIVTAYSRNPTLAGQDLGVLAGIEPLGVEVTGNREVALVEPADVLIVATTSFLREVAVDLRAGVEHGLNVITTAEEAAFPWLTDVPLSEELDQLSQARQVSILGVGLNPGFIFDALLLTATGVAWDVQRIQVRRVVDISRFSATIQRRLGIGFSQAEFEAGVKTGSITGHIGFPQSFALAAKCLGRTLERIEKTFEPLIAERAYINQHIGVEAGQTGGFIQRSTGLVNGQPWISAEFVAHVDPPAVGFTPADAISIEGYNPLDMTIRPGCNPQLGTAAMVANCIPRVIEARPGLLTVADLALPHARFSLNF
ncbi:MAG: NADP-binding protein [Chloroflexi bacterium]|nr:NADP-binding protein [Chloroflexota bacterium]